MANNSNTSSGIGFGGLLTIAFIVLKLTNVIDWSWVWVLSPLWIPVALVILFFVGALFFLKRKARPRNRYDRMDTMEDIKQRNRDKILKSLGIK